MPEIKMPINLSDPKHQLLTLPAVWLFAIFIAGWVGKSWVVDQFGFVTIAMAAEDKQEIEDKIVVLSKTVVQIQTAQNEHIQEFKFANAFQMERAYHEDLAQHLAQDVPHTAVWEAEMRKLESKARTATDYKACILESRPKATCDLLQQQLWQ